MLPPSDEQATTVRMFAFMNREQRVYMTRLLMQAREGYLLGSADIAIELGQLSYRIPTRAVGATIHKLFLLDAQGGEAEMTPVDPARKVEFRDVGGANGYTIESNSIILLATPGSVGTLRVSYARRANKIVPSDEAGEIQSINTGTGAVTLVDAPDDWSGTQSYDFIQGNPHFDTLASDKSASLVGNVLTFAAADLPDDLAVGDYIALKGETPIIQLPLECHDLLAQRACVKVLEAKRDPGLKAAKEMLDEMREDVLAIIKPRKEGEDDVLIDYDGPGWRRGFSGRRRGF